MSEINKLQLSTKSPQYITSANPMQNQEKVEQQLIQKVVKAQTKQDQIHIKLHDEELKQAREFDENLYTLYHEMRSHLKNVFEFKSKGDFPLEVQQETVRQYVGLCLSQLEDLVK
ncbi:Hypothetical_protein [Hexamita inflata]|uniref:Hypothetical_protein n=1 Tax=Hexamita inflata TaxID=28002 RepID=A0AA86V607_9EUKA|nr:Hypothetical protein HINF_LOCUS65461 [Hexamita inflata]